jgi:hypothetical protein
MIREGDKYGLQIATLRVLKKHRDIIEAVTLLRGGLKLTSSISGVEQKSREICGK